jgi:predicted nucleic acid-binding protein
MTVLVDSNVLIDVLQPNPRWAAWSGAALEMAGAVSRLVINPIVYAEISVAYPSIEELEDALPQDLFEREPLPYEAAFLAGKVFLAYRRRGGTRTSPLPDFLIGGHAAIAGYRLLTRDPTRYRAYFPQIDLIAPERSS